MKINYDEKNKTLSISECYYDAVEIYKDGVPLVDIPLVKGEGFWTNQYDIRLDDSFVAYPYNVIVVDRLQKEQTIED